MTSNHLPTARVGWDHEIDNQAQPNQLTYREERRHFPQAKAMGLVSLDVELFRKSAISLGFVPA